MLRCWNAEHFLQFLNHIICWEDGKIRIRTDEERSQQSLPLDTIREFTFAEPVDIIIEGPCSWEERHDHIPWLHTVLDGMKLPNVLMFPTCCGSYPEEFQEEIRKFFPDRNWLFPEMFDLYDNFGSDPRTLVAAQCLLKAGIIAPEDNSR